MYSHLLTYICIAQDLAVVSQCYTSLENYMDADSVSHMMHCEHLITDDDYEAITAAPNDSKMNVLLLQYVKSMNVSQLSRFCEILKDIGTHNRIIGDCSSSCKCSPKYVHTYRDKSNMRHS